MGNKWHLPSLTPTISLLSQMFLKLLVNLQRKCPTGAKRTLDDTFDRCHMGDRRILNNRSTCGGNTLPCGRGHLKTPRLTAPYWMTHLTTVMCPAVWEKTPSQLAEEMLHGGKKNIRWHAWLLSHAWQKNFELQFNLQKIPSCVGEDTWRHPGVLVTAPMVQCKIM
jgi:hypothetical protein